MLPPTPLEELRAVFVRLLAYAGGIGLIAYVATESARTPVVAAVEPAAKQAWIMPAKPQPAFEMSLPGAGEEQRYTIARHNEGGGRKDTIIFGEPGRTVHAMLVEIYRPGSEIESFADPASEVAVRTSALGLAGAVKPTTPIETKFGPFAAMDFLIGPSGTGHCIGFQRAFDRARLQIAGFACSLDSLVNREGIACALDRLTMLSSGNDPKVAELFAHAELKRQFCGQREVILTPTPKRPMPRAEQKAAPLRLRSQIEAGPPPLRRTRL
jgi:hypothetical protein